MLVAGVATGAAALSAGTALAGGIVRDLNVSTANHAATSVGTTFGTYSNTNTNADWIGLNNPVKTVGSYPNSQTGTSADWGLMPDIAANVTALNQLPAASSSGFTSCLSAYRFYISGRTGTALANRRVIGDSSLGATITPETASTYNGSNAGTFVWNSLGTGASGLASSYRLKVEQNVSIIDSINGDLGTALQLTTLKITRLTAGGAATDSLSLALTLGLLADVNPNFATSGTTQTNTSGAGEIRIRTTQTSSGHYAEVFGEGATSFDVGLRGTGSTNGLLQANARLFGTGDLSNSLNLNGASTTNDWATGLVWNTLTLAAVGDSLTITTGVLLVPAPGSMALLGIGGLLAARRRRN